MLWWLGNENDLAGHLWEGSYYHAPYSSLNPTSPLWFLDIALHSQISNCVLSIYFLFPLQNFEFTEAQQLLMSNVQQQMRNFHTSKRNTHRSSCRLGSAIWTTKRDLKGYYTECYLVLSFSRASAVLFWAAVNCHLQRYVKDKRQIIVIKTCYMYYICAMF